MSSTNSTKKTSEVEQNQPGTGGAEKDYFDEIEEVVGEANKKKYIQNQKATNNPHSNNHLHPHIRRNLISYDPVCADESEGDLSEQSDADSVLKFVEPSKKSVGISSENSDFDDDDEFYNRKRKPLATRRKSGIRPNKIYDSNYNARPDQDPNDPHKRPRQNWASVKKIVSLKLSSVSSTIPKVFRKKKSTDYKLQAFVAILFLAIILIVGSIYVIHQEKEIQKAYFNRIKFSVKDRRISVTNLKGREVLSGILGTSLTKKDKAWECLEANRRPGESCWEWMNLARLYFRTAVPRKDFDPSAHNMQCYGVFWESLNPNYVPKDCFNIGDNKNFYFYGGGEMNLNHWPLNRSFVPRTPFITGNKETEFQWGHIIRRYFVASPGVGIEIHKDTPLQISINEPSHNSMICFHGQRDSSAYPSYTGMNVLNYTLCTGDNIRDVNFQMSDKEVWDGLYIQDVSKTHAIAESPIWRILPQTLQNGLHTEAILLNHTDSIAALHLSEGFILFDESWQRIMGDMEMDQSRFPTISETLNITRRRGFKVALTVLPYFSTESLSFSEGLSKEIWVRQKLVGVKKELRVPALTTYKSETSVVLLDVTKEEARKWLVEKLSLLVKLYDIEGFYIDLGAATNFPEYFQFQIPLSSPDEYKDIFIRTVQSVRGVYTIGTTSAVKLPKLPTFVSMSPVESTWEGLQTILPNILSIGIAGFPFIIPGAVGGDYKVPLIENNKILQVDSTTEQTFTSQNEEDETFSSSGSITFKTSTVSSMDKIVPSTSGVPLDSFDKNKPDRDLYIRWLQLAHFLPVVQYTYLPSDYDAQVVEIARQLKITRKDKLFLYIKKSINDALTTGLPIIRPLWMTDPTDVNCLKVWDEFTIGDYILVAPVLYKNMTEREIYLPKGRWRDEKDGSGGSMKGERWIHHYRVKYNQIPFFTKLVDPN